MVRAGGARPKRAKHRSLDVSKHLESVLSTVSPSTLNACSEKRYTRAKGRERCSRVRGYASFDSRPGPSDETCSATLSCLACKPGVRLPWRTHSAGRRSTGSPSLSASPCLDARNAPSLAALPLGLIGARVALHQSPFTAFPSLIQAHVIDFTEHLFCFFGKEKGTVRIVRNSRFWILSDRNAKEPKSDGEVTMMETVVSPPATDQRVEV